GVDGQVALHGRNVHVARARVDRKAAGHAFHRNAAGAHIDRKTALHRRGADGAGPAIQMNTSVHVRSGDFTNRHIHGDSGAGRYGDREVRMRLETRPTAFHRDPVTIVTPATAIVVTGVEVAVEGAVL